MHGEPLGARRFGGGLERFERYDGTPRAMVRVLEAEEARRREVVVLAARGAGRDGGGIEAAAIGLDRVELRARDRGGGAGPARIEPTGAPSPLEKHICTVSATAA